jgi:hypothetical protein
MIPRRAFGSLKTLTCILRRTQRTQCQRTAQAANKKEALLALLALWCSGALVLCALAPISQKADDKSSPARFLESESCDIAIKMSFEAVGRLRFAYLDKGAVLPAYTCYCLSLYTSVCVVPI